MKKIVKLTESDLVRIVKKVINESSLNKSMILSAKQKLSSCWEPSNYPQLSKVAEGSAQVAFGLLLVFVAGAEEWFSLGFATPLAAATGALAGTNTYNGYKKLYDANSSKINGDLEKLKKCVG